MIVRTIRDYLDIQTGELFKVSDENPIRKVSDERGRELISKGVAEQVIESVRVASSPVISEPKEEKKPKKDKGSKKKVEVETETTAEDIEVEETTAKLDVKETTETAAEDTEAEE